MAIKQLSPVPPLPANYAERRGLGGAVAQSLQKCLQASGLCLVHGAGGMGKTVQTCATIHQETVLSEIFPDGVAYVTVGQSPDLVHLQSQLLRAFGVFEAPTDLSDGYAKLFGALAGRKALLILDDVWDAQHLEFLVPLKGRPKSWLQNAVLITSRRVDLLGSAELLRLGELTEEEAQQLLKLEGDLPLVAKLAKLCSKSPLALSILGATGLREEERTSSKRSSIFNSFLTELTGRKEEPNAVKRCIELCSKRLSSEELELYLDLAVFPDDVLLPVGALRNIFAGRDLEALKELERLHLLGGLDGGDEQLVRLHDLSLEFVKEHAVKRGMGEKKLHEDLLENYSRCLKAPRNWWTGPDDGYFFQRLLYHLSLAGRGEEGRALLLRWEWMASRLRRPGDVIAVVAELKAFAPKGSLRPSPISGSGTAAATALGSSQQAKARA
ncbi:unnamed protein product [Durusdinium trenchii]|uniref:NB-ARC domain-containing protein n=1 Tax=Durusdinium trenchii TaxID=1381693 RepID=A0ABP0MZZ7_9DINO